MLISKRRTSDGFRSGLLTMANVLGTSVEYLTGATDHELPTSYLIEASSDPELFYLIDVYKKSTLEDQNRFLEYAKEWQKKTSR